MSIRKNETARVACVRLYGDFRAATHASCGYDRKGFPVNGDRWVTPGFDGWLGTCPDDDEKPDGATVDLARPKEDRPRRDFGRGDHGSDRDGDNDSSSRQRSW